MILDALDTYGQVASRTYTFGKLLLDSSFEPRLKRVDPNLKLVFDNTSSCWTILEWALDNSGWNVLLRAKDEEGNDKPFGEWVFNKLWVWRKNAEEKARVGVTKWMDNLDYEADRQKVQILKGHSREFQGRIVDDINEFRKGFKIMNNEAPSDVTAGYPKITRRQDGTV